MYRIASAALAIAIALSTTPLDAREIRSGGAAPEASPWGKLMNDYVAHVAEVSGGKLTVNHFHNSELGDEQTMARQTARGRLDMALLSNTGASMLVPEYALTAAPYLYSSAAQADCVSDEHLTNAFGDAFEAAGVHPVVSMFTGNQILLGKTLIRSPDDLHGLKIRTAPTIPDTVYLKTAGGNVVPLGTVDTMPALKTGNVNAVSWPALYGIAAGYAAEAPQITVTNHSVQVGLMVVSKRLWDSLSDEEKGWLTPPPEMFDGLRETVRQTEKSLLNKVEAEGATVYYPDAEDLAAWKSFAPAAQKAIVADMGGNAAEVWKTLVAATAACSD
ncbi:TRAP transporter substrate-binding protein DctP [Chachezhania sediminis]|uniref:TRAP transporter substrate-binding protein DctP n=1 Tax=Chachezhania sediminis TaxID=2599291 RepID=UPI00131E3C7F|nr:TRAP transporter substrate-binding protein DctP [Chachezhania sediminis]